MTHHTPAEIAELIKRLRDYHAEITESDGGELHHTWR